MKYKLNKHIILEAFTGNQKEIFDKTLSKTEKGLNTVAGVPVVGPIPAAVGQMTAGYKVGQKLGHPVAGIALGRSGALGATSAEPGSKLNVTDAYTSSNMINKLIAGGSSGAVTGGLMGGVPGAIAGAAIGGGTAAATVPGIQYGLGKVFSGKPVMLKKN